MSTIVVYEVPVVFPENVAVFQVVTQQEYFFLLSVSSGGSGSPIGE